MVKLRIDNREVEVAAGGTVLDAARKLGIDVPALCQREGCSPNTACLCCVVKVNGGARLVPSCATKAAEGMVVESETEEVRAARKMALELLLADHAGDCLAPCTNTCPARMDIPTMIRQIEAGEMREAIVTVKEMIALPAVLGRICPELCEKNCRRAAVDEAVSICQLKRYVADVDLASERPYLPPCRENSGKRVAIVGSGPAGLAAAWYLLQMGHGCVILDDHERPGGNLRYAVDPAKLPHDVLDAEIDLVRQLGAEFRMNVRVGRDVTVGQLREQYDAVLIAAGELDGAKAKAMGLETEGKGLKVDRKSMMTPLPGVFGAGAALTPYRFAVRAVSVGRHAAHVMDQYLRGEKPVAEGYPFTVRLGVLNEVELGSLKVGAEAGGRTAKAADGTGFSDAEAGREGARCMGCDCAKLNNCGLRDYSMAYGASQGAYKTERKAFERVLSHPFVVYEPGKCIACGLCVQITERAREPLGLTYIGRGFKVKIGVPFEGAVSAGLQKVAEECVKACPTGALSGRRQ